jgi:hypothetical protein
MTLRIWGAAGVVIGMIGGSLLGVVVAQTVAPAAAAQVTGVVDVIDLIKGVAALGALVGVYVALDRRVTRLETTIDHGFKQLLDKLDGKHGVLDRLDALETKRAP